MPGACIRHRTSHFGEQSARPAALCTSWLCMKRPIFDRCARHCRASDKCQREKRKTINGDDLLWAMSTLGFEEYVEPLKLYLSKYREVRLLLSVCRYSPLASSCCQRCVPAQVPEPCSVCHNIIYRFGKCRTGLVQSIIAVDIGSCVAQWGSGHAGSLVQWKQG